MSDAKRSQRAEDKVKRVYRVWIAQINAQLVDVEAENAKEAADRARRVSRPASEDMRIEDMRIEDLVERPIQAVRKDGGK